MKKYSLATVLLMFFSFALSYLLSRTIVHQLNEDITIEVAIITLFLSLISFFMTKSLKEKVTLVNTFEKVKNKSIANNFIALLHGFSINFLILAIMIIPIIIAQVQVLIVATELFFVLSIIYILIMIDRFTDEIDREMGLK